jgi:uncharacterized protein
MPGLESMRHRLSSLAKTLTYPTTAPSHTDPDTRLLDPDYFSIDVEDLTWFNKVNLAVRRDTEKLSTASDYMHIQRVSVSAWNLYQADTSHGLAGTIDSRTVVVAAMVSSLGALMYAHAYEEQTMQQVDTAENKQTAQNDLLFDFLRSLDCPPDVAGPAALVASIVGSDGESNDNENFQNHCEAYPALKFVQDAVKLDELGCVGIARLGVQNKETILEMVHTMDTKLVHYAGSMKTKSGKKEAEKRWSQMLEFRECFISQTDCSIGLMSDRKRTKILNKRV